MDNLQIIDEQANPFYNALATEIELKNGKLSKIITLFNCKEIDFEVVNIGIREALERSHNVKTMKSTFCTVSNGTIKEVAFYGKEEIKEYIPELDPKLKHIL